MTVEHQRWEYAVLDGMERSVLLADKTLNGMGWSGWELVAVVPLAESVQIVFKRPILLSSEK